MRRIALSIALTAFVSGANAAELTLELPDSGDITVERNRVIYDCGEKEMTVEYLNAGPVSLAVFAFDGEPVVASNVIAASGARYAAGRYIWWTKGPGASLYDATLGENAAAIAACTQRR